MCACPWNSKWKISKHCRYNLPSKTLVILKSFFPGLFSVYSQHIYNYAFPFMSCQLSCPGCSVKSPCVILHARKCISKGSTLNYCVNMGLFHNQSLLHGVGFSAAHLLLSWASFLGCAISTNIYLLLWAYPWVFSLCVCMWLVWFHCGDHFLSLHFTRV